MAENESKPSASPAQVDRFLLYLKAERRLADNLVKSYTRVVRDFVAVLCKSLHNCKSLPNAAHALTRKETQKPKEEQHAN